MSDLQKLEYRVKEVTRYVVTRYHETSDGQSTSSGSETKGEFDNRFLAHEVACSLCGSEHERLGYPIDDERIQYPKLLEDSAKK